jgi:hypothetical protein
MSDWKKYIGESINTKELEKLFFELDFSNEQNLELVINKIAEQIPWQTSVYDIIDDLENTALRINSRRFIPNIQKEITNIYLAQVTKKGFTNNYDELEGGVFLLSLMGDNTATYKDFKLNLDKLKNSLNPLTKINLNIDETVLQSTKKWNINATTPRRNKF